MPAIKSPFLKWFKFSSLKNRNVCILYLASHLIPVYHSISQYTGLSTLTHCMWDTRISNKLTLTRITPFFSWCLCSLHWIATLENVNSPVLHKRNAGNRFFVLWTPIATCDNNSAVILSHLVFHMCVSGQKTHLGILWQHVSHMFMSISHILHQGSHSV